MLYLLVKTDGKIIILLKDAYAGLSLRHNQLMAERSLIDLEHLGIRPSFFAADSHPANNIDRAQFNRLAHLTRLNCRKHLLANILIRTFNGALIQLMGLDTTYDATLKPLKNHAIPMIAAVFARFKNIETMKNVNEEAFW